jgi:Ni/Co efflux regulator RcnB
MNRRKFLAMASAFCAAASTAAAFDRDHGSDDHGKYKGHGRGGDDDDDDERHDSRRPGQYFREGDYIVLRRYYRGPSSLPPGLRKKYYRTGTLPPGWQKKMRPLPVAVVRELPPLSPNCGRGYIDGYAVVYDRKTRVILDTIDLIGAITGR